MRLPRPAGAPKPTRLKVTDPRGFEKVVLIDKDVFPIGREAAEGLQLPDAEPFSVAGRHALVIRDGDTFVLKDESGSCGTRVNGRPIRSTVLKHGDEIALGASPLRIQFLVEGTRASDLEEMRIKRLLQMLRELHSCRQSQDVCAWAAAGIMGLVGSEWAAISLTSSRERLEMVAGLDRSGTLPGGPSAIAQHVVASSRSYFHPARLCVAIMGRGEQTGHELLGVIDAGPRGSLPYKGEDLELLEALAAQVGVALANSRWLEAPRQPATLEVVSR